MKVVDRDTLHQAGSKDTPGWKEESEAQGRNTRPECSAPTPTARESADIIVWEEV